MVEELHWLFFQRCKNLADFQANEERSIFREMNRDEQ